MPSNLFEKQYSIEINNEIPKEIKMEDYDVESSNMIASCLSDDDLNVLNYKKIKIQENWFIWLKTKNTNIIFYYI